MRRILGRLRVLPDFVVPDRTRFDARIHVLDRSVAGLSIQIEQIKARDQQLQQQSEKMRVDCDQRLNP
jgi:hypothetical protein